MSVKNPDHIEVVFRVACDGIPLDNYHETFEEAAGYFSELSKLPDREYTIVEIVTVETVHSL